MDSVIYYSRSLVAYRDRARNASPYFHKTNGAGQMAIVENARTDIPHPYPRERYMYGANIGKAMLQLVTRQVTANRVNRVSSRSL
jgi:hypothetical protein